MTGVTLDLTRDQARELRDLDAGTLARPSTNLIRRGMAELLAFGTGRYRLTALGRAALERQPAEYPLPLRGLPPRGIGQR